MVSPSSRQSSSNINSCRIGEKFLEWVDDPLPPDHILESITLYWLTDTFPRSIYTYRQVSLAMSQLLAPNLSCLTRTAELSTSANSRDQLASLVYQEAPRILLLPHGARSSASFLGRDNR